MSEKFSKCVRNLNLINNLPAKSRKAALVKLACNRCYYMSIKEIAKNIVKKNLKPTNIKKIKTHWKNIVEISGVNKERKRSKTEQKNLVIQSGGWIWSVIPIVLSLLDSLRQ